MSNPIFAVKNTLEVVSCKFNIAVYFFGIFKSSTLALVFVFLLSSCSQYLSHTAFALRIPDFVVDGGVLSAEEAVHRVQKYDLLVVNTTMTSYVERYITKDMTQKEKMNMLVRLLIGPAFLNIEYDANGTYTAEQVFLQGSANCVGFTNLYIALARYFGIDASYQLIRGHPEWNRHDDGEQVTSLAIHLNGMLTLPSGKRFIVDITPKPIQKKGEAETISDSTAKALFYNNLAIDYFIKSDFKQAYQNLSKAVSYDVKLDMLWLNLGAVFRRNNQLKDAETAYKFALKLNPNSYAAMNNLSVLYKKQGDDVLYELYRQKTRWHRLTNPYYYLQLARHAEKEGDYKTAILHIRRAIRLKGDDPEFEKLLNEFKRLFTEY